MEQAEPGADLKILEVLAFAEASVLYRPCVDCGRRTGNFCEGVLHDCLAEDRIPSEHWAEGQMTPQCTECERKHVVCHFCRGLQWATPPPHGPLMSELTEDDGVEEGEPIEDAEEEARVVMSPMMSPTTPP